jgi:hypothetical protein
MFINFIKNVYNKFFGYNKLNKAEDYYNNKYPKENISYIRTDRLGTLKIDVRQFLNKNNFNFPNLIGITDDEIALQSLLYVKNKIKYVSDKTQYKLNEYWSFNYETLERKKGDCEDGAILLYCIMRYNNIPAWKIRINAGDVDDGKGNKGGHCFVVYYCEEQDSWKLLDWCYWSNNNKIKDRKDYKEETNYKSTWFSFNEDYSWAKDIKDIPKLKNIERRKQKKKK